MGLPLEQAARHGGLEMPISAQIRHFTLVSGRLRRLPKAVPEYSEFVDRVLGQAKLLHELCPKEPLDPLLVRSIREADDASLGGRAAEPGSLVVIRAGLFYALDALDPAHRIFQEEKSDLGSYWHGMMHRREADFDNARYWFRRSGRLPFFDRLHGKAAKQSAVMARQSSWDPYLFTGECEQERFGADEKTEELRKLQRAEFDVIFEYTWRRELGAGAA
jgi:hypothetical protein